MYIKYENLIFKKINKNNLQAIIELENEVVNNIKDVNYYSGLGKLKIEQSAKDKKNLCYAILNLKNELMGYVIFTNYDYFPQNYKALVERFCNNLNKENTYYYRAIAISNKFRGHHIMDKTIKYFNAYAKEHNIQNILTLVHPDNFASKSNFLKNDYTLLTNVFFENNNPRNILIKNFK